MLHTLHLSISVLTCSKEEEMPLKCYAMHCIYICNCVGNFQHAISYVQGEKYYGAKATINVWEPKIEQPNEFSLSQLWILGGSFGEDLNSIEAGWQVPLKDHTQSHTAP